MKMNCYKNPFRLTIIGGGGAIGLPASYLASRRNLKVVMIDSGSGALNNSTHTVHTSIVRPHRAVWPFGKAIESWWNNGPFDMRLDLGLVPFGFHSLLQSYCVSENRTREMWKAFRTLGLESRDIYLDFEKEFGKITLGGAGRGHMSSPLIADDADVVLSLREKLSGFGVKSKIMTDSKIIQDYVGMLPVRSPQLIVSYPEDFVLDLHQYKAKLLGKVHENGGTFLQDTAVGIERDSVGNVTTVITKKGLRIPTDAVLYAGGWQVNEFLKSWFGINLGSHLNVATGVRFALPGHLINRSIVCGSMFMAPGHDAYGNEVTDIGQMFLVNVKDPTTSEKHRSQAIRRFNTYFDYKGDIPELWNCVGRPITTTGLPFIERVAPNMVVALGPGMFGVTVGTGVAQRGLELLLDNKTHPDHEFFQRQSARKIMSCFFMDKLTSKMTPVINSPQSSNSSRQNSRVVQIGKRGAMTSILHQTLAQNYDLVVYGAREIDSVISDIRTGPDTILLVASHGMQAKLPEKYGKGYVSADEAIEKVLAKSSSDNLLGIITISGGITKSALQELKVLARNKKVRFVYLPGLATSMEVLLNVARNVLLNTERPIKVFIEDTFHRAKREYPSAGSLQLFADVAKTYGESRLLILVSDTHSCSELTAQYPNAIIKIARTDIEIQQISHQYPHLIPVISRSYRIDTPYHYQHRLTLQEQKFTITMEQKVSDRAKLVPPIQQVIQRLPSLPSSFSGTGISSVIPGITFEPNPSFASIIASLQRTDAIISIQTREAELSGWMQEILTDASGRAIESVYTPSLSYCLQINAMIDGQHFSISFSRNDT